VTILQRVMYSSILFIGAALLFSLVMFDDLIREYIGETGRITIALVIMGGLKKVCDMVLEMLKYDLNRH
jgi:Na+-transporting NADH:ubiquinone oxidoreductase subunit NqrD